MSGEPRQRPPDREAPGGGYDPADPRPPNFGHRIAGGASSIPNAKSFVFNITLFALCLPRCVA